MFQARVVEARIGIQRSRSLETAIGYPDAMVASPQGDRTLLVAGSKRNPQQ